MYGFRRGSGGAGGSGNVSTLSGGANGRVTLWNGPTTVTGDASGTWGGTGHTFVIGSPTFDASDGHFTGPAGASFGPSAVGGGFTNQPAGDTIDLVSDDAGDTTQQVTVIGVLAGVDASENIALNGVTTVTSVGTYDLILALVLNNACTGTVTASETSGGLAITTIAPAALSAGLQTFAVVDGYGKVLQIVASGATTKTVGIGGYALGGGIQREPVVLTGTTKVNTTNTWEGAVQFYLGDLEATRTVTLNSIAGFDFKSTGGVFEPIEAGSLAASNLTPGQVLLASAATGSTGATSITGDTGCTWTGTGNSFVGTFGYGVSVGAGTAAAPSVRVGEAGTGLFLAYGNKPTLATGTALSTGFNSFGPVVKAAGQYQFSSTSDPHSTADLALSRASAGTLLVEDGSGNARDVQARTGTFGTSVVTPVLTSSGQLTMYSGSGTQVVFNPGAANKGWGMDPTGPLFPVTDDMQDFGVTGARIRTGYFGTSLVSPLLVSGPGKSGTNVAGTNHTIQAEPGTGSATGSSIIFRTPTAGASGTTAQTQTTRLTLSEPAVIAAVPVRLMGYTVATLPAGTVGDTAYVTDAIAPAFGVALVGGGAVVIPAFYDGANWIAH